MFIKLMKIKEKVFDYMIPIFTKAIFNLKLESEKFNIFIDTKCLVLSAHPGDETFAMGGFMAKHPKNFEVISVTDGSLGVPKKGRVDARFIRRKEFSEVMETLRVRGHKILGIEEGKLFESYHQFAKLDVSEIDYIFAPNIFEQDADSKALLLHLKKLLEEKEYKKTLKIVFYELNSTLSFPNCSVDISSTIGRKQEMMLLYVSQFKAQRYPDIVMSLNKFRSMPPQEYAESFMVMDVESFKELSSLINSMDITSIL